MYVTRPLSMYMRSPELLFLPTPEGPNSGYLVLQDEESIQTSCFGMCKHIDIKQLPFPQNMDLTVGYTEDINDEVTFIPVLDQPLSSNTYYVIRRSGRHRGEACTSWKDPGLFPKNYINEVEPKALDPSDVYQQMEIMYSQRWRERGDFTAKSVASDGIPPRFLREKGWRVYRRTPYNYELDEAQGLDSSLRSRLPGFDVPLSLNQNDCSEAVVVGKWYCPFMFIKEGGVRLKEQMKTCVFYEMRLEQRWEKIFSSDNEGASSGVFVDTFVPREVVFVGGNEAVCEDRERNVSEGFMWFKSSDGVEGEKSVGLSMKIVERMKWEQERVGWVGGDERQVRVERVEEFGGTGEWKKFACYVLVERFLLKRMHERLAVLAYDFKHPHQIRSKWE